MKEQTNEEGGMKMEIMLQLHINKTEVDLWPNLQSASRHPIMLSDVSWDGRFYESGHIATN